VGLSGFTFSKGEDLDANVGVFDCLAAAQWTSKYIRKFGGDGKRITVAGQSAGAGMIYYMSALYGGKGKLPFQQVSELMFPAGSGRHAHWVVRAGIPLIHCCTWSTQRHDPPDGEFPSRPRRD
jgi:hypothetical protein